MRSGERDMILTITTVGTTGPIADKLALSFYQYTNRLAMDIEGTPLKKSVINLDDSPFGPADMVKLEAM